MRDAVGTERGQSRSRAECRKRIAPRPIVAGVGYAASSRTPAPGCPRPRPRGSSPCVRRCGPRDTRHFKTALALQTPSRCTGVGRIVVDENAASPFLERGHRSREAANEKTDDEASGEQRRRMKNAGNSMGKTAGFLPTSGKRSRLSDGIVRRPAHLEISRPKLLAFAELCRFVTLPPNRARRCGLWAARAGGLAAGMRGSAKAHSALVISLAERRSSRRSRCQVVPIHLLCPWAFSHTAARQFAEITEFISHRSLCRPSRLSDTDPRHRATRRRGN